MKKVLVLILMSIVGIGSMWADDVATLQDLKNSSLNGTLFRLRCTTTENLYMTIVATEGTNHDNGGVNIKSSVSNSENQIFYLQPSNEDGKFQIQALSGYNLASFPSWGYKATASEGEFHSIEFVETGVFKLKTSKGYVGTNDDATSDDSKLFSNHGANKNNIKWAFEVVSDTEKNSVLTSDKLATIKGTYTGSKLTSLQSSMSSLMGSKLGQFSLDETAFNTANSNLESATTLGGMVTAYYDCLSAYRKKMLEVGKCYRIKSSAHGTYMGIDGFTLNVKNQAADDNNPTFIWKYEKDGDNYYLKNVYSGLYPQNVPSGSAKTVAVGTDKSRKFTYAIYTEPTSDNDAVWNLYVGGTQLNVETNGNVNSWNGVNAHHIIYEVTETDDAIANMCTAWYSSNKYTTLESDFPEIPVAGDAGEVISPSEIAAPATINTDIQALKTVVSSLNEGTPTVENINAVYSTLAAGNLRNYKNAITSYGSLLSIEYTPTAEWATIILPVNFSNPTGWERYRCSAVGEDNTLTLAPFGEGTTKNTPMIVNVGIDNINKKYQFIGYSNGAATENQTGGILVGVLESGSKVPTGSYILATYQGKQAFYPVAEGANYEASMYHCYLTLPSGSARYNALYFDGTETGIGEVSVDKTIDNPVLYDLSGRRVMTPNRGLYIANGKVVVR